MLSDAGGCGVLRSSKNQGNHPKSDGASSYSPFLDDYFCEYKPCSDTAACACYLWFRPLLGRVPMRQLGDDKSLRIQILWHHSAHVETNAVFSSRLILEYLLIPIVYPLSLVGTWHHILMAPSRRELPIPGSSRQGCVHRQLEKTVQFERKVAQRYRPPLGSFKTGNHRSKMGHGGHGWK